MQLKKIQWPASTQVSLHKWTCPDNSAPMCTLFYNVQKIPKDHTFTARLLILLWSRESWPFYIYHLFLLSLKTNTTVHPVENRQKIRGRKTCPIFLLCNANNNRTNSRLEFFLVKCIAEKHITILGLFANVWR